MTQIAIRHPVQAAQRSCGLCGRRTVPLPGPSLCLPESLDAVCQECGKEHAPELAALLDLARVAQRVGRINRHTLVPSFHELLDLARAAENYTHSACVDVKQAS